MTDKEIIRAREVCACLHGKSCAPCPYYIDKGRAKCLQMKKDVLNLINRQKAEIERLSAKSRDDDRYIKTIKDDLNLAKEDIEFKKEEIERLDKEVGYWEAETKEARADIDQAVAEAIKGFAERLKLHSYIVSDESQTGIINTYSVVTANQIDNLVKEMVGEDNHHIVDNQK